MIESATKAGKIDLIKGVLDLTDFHKLLEEQKLVKKIGGLDTLIDIVEANPSGANADEYASFVVDMYTRRRMIYWAGELMDAAYNHDAEVDFAVLKVLGFR